MDITVLELHFPEAEFNTPFSKDSRDSSGGSEDRPGRRTSVDESNGGGRSSLAAIAVLIGLAAVAWYLRSNRGREGLETGDVPTRRTA